MGLNHREMAEERQEFQKYKWEFVRRNKEFKKMTEEFQGHPTEDLHDKVVEEFGFSPTMDFNKSLQEMAGEQRTKKYRIEEEKDPKEYDLATELLSYWPLFLEGKILSIDGYSEQSMDNVNFIEVPMVYKEVPLEKDKLKETLKNAKTLQVSINLQCTEDQIKDYIGGWINLFKLLRGDSEDEESRQRKSKSKYGKYLDVYDLREEGRSFPYIAEKAFKDDIDKEKGLDGLIVKAKRQYKEAERLVKEGHKDIR